MCDFYTFHKMYYFCFFFNDPATTEIYTLSLHDALPISDRAVRVSGSRFTADPEYTIKLEGVRQGGYSTILMGGVRDPFILGDLDNWLKQLDDNNKIRIGAMVGNSPYEIVTRIYGKNGVMGALEPEVKA